MQKEVTIRAVKPEDYDQIWEIIRQVIKTGDTYVFDPDSSREKILGYWIAPDKHCFVAEVNGAVAGSFLIKSNQPDLGNHVANASYIVHPEFRGLGIGRMMGEASISKARELGYHAMQFNYVIKTNTTAVTLWKSLGFRIVGEVPNAYRHQQLGLTNVYIFYREL
ncbi:Histone acetyltransferase HPA2 [Fulvivirga imtechensis AK7]|uniref:Histone acetyltransferase HPA2 n=1 Tax=Fulvivirga imtechensis AK7 TaxID=1237149 RepID=L8JMY1_9BACT|nr:N-acetyltransferase [Fulvivirga imtechensis]ELR68869.1 Histone acetyltransferase HPA2 [Fulvivirga imtechensis AK7]